MKRNTTFLTWSKNILNLCLACLFSFSLVFTICSFYQNYKLDQRFDKLDKAFEQAQTEMEIKELSELKGRLRTVKLLSYSTWKIEGLEDELRKEIDEIIAFQEDIFKDNYSSFHLEYETSEDLDEICEELSLQIENQIEEIQYGSEGD